MSHHFDTPTAKEDPRINVCDFYLFRGRPGTTVMALTVNPNAGVGAPDTFRDEGLYAFRFDTNRDLREDVAFKVQFGAPAHADGGERRHVQTFAVRRATGADALKGAAGELITPPMAPVLVPSEKLCGPKTGSGLFDAPPSSRSCPGDFWQAKVIARITFFAFALSVPSSRAGADDFIIGSSTRARESGGREPANQEYDSPKGRFATRRNRKGASDHVRLQPSTRQVPPRSRG